MILCEEIIMNTKLAIEILSESHNEITAFLVGLGLLENESVMTELEVEFEAAFTIFLDEYGELKNNFVIASSEVERVEEDLIFANDYHRIQEERLQGLLAKQDALNREIEIFEEQKESIENFSDEEKLVIESNIAQIEQDIENTETELEELRQNPNTNKELIDALESEWNSHILRYQLQKDLLSLSDLDLTQKLDLVKLQIEQQREDLGTLTQKIIEQESIVNDAKNNLSSIQANLEQLNATETSAETALNKFEVANGYLLAEDVTDFLDWNINEASPDVVKLWQQVLAVKGEEIISERLTSLTSQESSEEAVNIALEQDRNEDYIVLGAELAKEIGNLSEIWLENLEESHQLTVNVWNLSQQRTDAVNGLETYIEDNLASPEGEYVLDKIQLEEAIAREEAQVEYADALTYSVDSLEDAIEVLTTQQQQVEVLSKKIEHISILTNLENQYATLGNQASKELRLELIEILNEELNLKIQDFTIKINLINEQQELWLENELQEYINQKQNQIIDIKNQHLSSINITQTNLAFSSEQYGFNALNITSAYFGRGYDHLPRFMADVNGDGRADFGRFEGGGHIPISLYFNLAGENGFIEEIYQLSPGTDIGYNHLPRFMSDVNGDGRADFGRFVGGGNGTPIHLSFVLAEENGFSSQEYGFNTIKAGFDKGYDHLPRFMADVNGDGRADFGRFIGGGNGTPIHLSFNLAESAEDELELIQPIEEQAISDLQNLRVETTYLTLQAEQNPDKLQQYLEAFQASDKTEATVNNLRNQYYPALSEATTLYNLQQQINDELTNSQQELETLKTLISQKQANATAALSQADWYEDQAQIHWDLSRKAGPTWNEYRTSKGSCGRTETITVTHVDHHWIIWDTYQKQATNLRQYAANLDEEIIENTHQQVLNDQLITQWMDANEAADEAELTLDQFIEQLEILQAQRELLPQQVAQLETFSNLLPALQEQLAIAQLAAKEAKVATATELAEYKTSSHEYQTAFNDVLSKKASLETETQNLLQQIANTRAWILQQSLYLDTELSDTIKLKQQLQTQIDAIAIQTSTAETETEIAQLQQSVDLLINKQIILTSQQAALTQQNTLLEAQTTVIETEYQLLLATIESPDNDYSNLEGQLLEAQNALEEIQTLAQQAEASSIALTTSIEDLQGFLQLQNDQYLASIQTQQQILQELVDATELQENYTLLATEKQLELNSLESQLQTRLIEATEAGSTEAAYLLEVASANNFATAAEIYYEDYRDLMTDTGGGCAGGIARPEDGVKADYYYNEMLRYQALQEQAQQQADHFAQVKEAAQDQIDLIQQQTEIAQVEFQDLQASLNTTQENIEDLEQQLNIAELRIDALEYLRNWTEQTSIQLLQVEQLNLAQATLEQEFAQQRQLGIDETITAQFEKQQAGIERDRAIAVAKLEQLNQLQAEDVLQQALNDLRSDLGLQPIEDIIQEAEYFGQLAGILSDLENLQAETELPENIRTILAETTADIEDALQGREAATIEENLLNSANALITEANLLQTEIATLDEEEVRLSAILEQSETDLQGATKALYDEIINNQELGAETDDINQDYLEVLYQIGYAEGAVDLSSTLAQQSKDILDEIIEGRIIEREARKKAFINELFGTITLVLSVAAAAITAGASLAATAFVQPTISVTLSSISAGLSAVQSAYNGDWSGAIFNAGIAGLGFAHVGGFDLPSGTQIPGVEDFLDVQRVAEGAYSAYQAAESGDNISALLNIFSAALPITGLEQYNYLSQAALSIHGGVQLAEEGEWLAATSNFLNAAFSLGSELNGQEGSFNIDLGLSPQILNIISLIEVGTNIINGIKGITEDGSLEGLLNGIKTVADGFTTYYSEQQTIDQLTNFKQELLLQNILQQPDITNEEIQNLASKYGLENIFVRQEKNGQEQIYITREFELNQNNQGGLITRGEIDPNQATILVTFGWLNNVSPDWNFDVAELLESKYPNHNIIIGDWSELAQDINYFSAASDTKLAGQEIAKQLHELQIDFSQLQIIGHSLGAQVAGAIGEYAKENYYTEVSTIIGLDPASPGFERNTLIFLPYSSNERRLDDSDADNVILVRSDYEGLFPRGYTNPLGDLDIKITREVLDFYINSDPSQQNPYLIDNPSVGPDHSVAFEFLIDALNQGFSLDNLDQFLQVRQEQLPSELDYTTDKSNHLNNLRSILNSDDITVTYNNPLPYFLKSSEYSLGSYQIATNDIVPLDPIIIDLDGNGLELSDLSTSSIFFDIDADGYAENTAWTTDSILTFDLNQDGIINNISEVFSEYFNDGSPNSGLDALATLDSNQNGIISATDSQFDQILVWLDINQDGISQPDELKPLSDHGITSISLNGITTETIQEGNIIKKRSIFNRNDGTSGEISDVAFLVTQTGFIVNQTDTGIEILAEDDTAVSLLIHEQTTDLTLNLADSNLQVAIGNIGNDFLYTTANNNDVFLSGETGNDTLVGSEGDDWLLGDEGEDNLQGGAGDDLLYIDAQDTLIDGGDGTDIAIVTTADALTLDLGTANLEMVIGNNGDDIFTHSDNYTVIIDGGEGNDQLTGGNNDDVLTGGIGDDLIYGNDGNDRLEGGDGLDILYGSQGNDSLNGGEGIDTAIFYGIEHDFNIIYEGSSTIVMDLNPTDGDEGINILTGIENIQFVTNDQALLS